MIEAVVVAVSAFVVSASFLTTWAHWTGYALPIELHNWVEGTWRDRAGSRWRLWFRASALTIALATQLLPLVLVAMISPHGDAGPAFVGLAELAAFGGLAFWLTRRH